MVTGAPGERPWPWQIHDVQREVLCQFFAHTVPTAPFGPQPCSSAKSGRARQHRQTRSCAATQMFVFQFQQCTGQMSKSSALCPAVIDTAAAPCFTAQWAGEWRHKHVARHQASLIATAGPIAPITGWIAVIE